MKSIAIPTIYFNFNNAQELYEKTGFSIAYEIDKRLMDSGLSKFIVGDIKCELQLGVIATDRDFDNGMFSVFVESYNENAIDKISNDNNLKRQIIDQIQKIVDYLNSEPSIEVPVNNLDNTIYIDREDTFYVKLGENMPNTIKLVFSFEQTIDDICWD